MEFWKIKKQVHSSLHRKIILPILCIELFSSFFVSYFVYTHYMDHFQAHILSRAYTISNAIKYAVQTSKNVNETKHYIQAIANEDDIKNINITLEGSNKIVSTANLRVSNQTFPPVHESLYIHPVRKVMTNEYKAHYIFLDTENIFSMVTPLLIFSENNSNILERAWLYLDLDTQHEYDRWLASLIKLGAFLFCALVIVTYCIYFIVTRHIFRPMLEASSAVNKRLLGCKKTFLPVHSNDELGQVVMAFNNLLRAEERYIQKLKESEQRYKSLYTDTPAMLHTINSEGKIISVSNYWLNKLGYKANEVLGKPPTDFLSPASSKQTIKSFQRLIKTGHGKNLYCQFISKHGKTLDILLSATTDNSKNYQHSLAVLIDITEKMKAEKKLEDTIKELIESNTQLEHFAYIASHDMQEPLRMMISFTDLLDKKYKDKLDAKGKSYIAYIQSSAMYMHRLINDLLDYASLNSKQKDIEKVNCIELISYIEQTFLDSKNNFSLTHSGLPILYVNSTELFRLLQNLIANGIKYSKKSNLTKIHIEAIKKPNNIWLFCVSDNGIGIKQEYLKKIFEPFKRLHRREEYFGTGIGLSICKKIIENFGGEIWAESELGKGTKFYFTVPQKTNLRNSK